MTHHHPPRLTATDAAATRHNQSAAAQSQEPHTPHITQEQAQALLELARRQDKALSIMHDLLLRYEAQIKAYRDVN